MEKLIGICWLSKPKLLELEEDYGDRVGFYSVDVEEEINLFSRFSLKGVPQVLFFNEEGDFVTKLAGEKPVEEYESKIEEILKGA